MLHKNHVCKRRASIIALFFALAALSATLTLLSGKNASAEQAPMEITDESLFVTEYIDGVLTITDFHPPAAGPNMTDIVVPPAVQGQKIRGIGARAFANAGTNIHNLYLPDTLEVIGKEAFSSYALDNVASYTYTATGEFAQADTKSAEQPLTVIPTVESGSVTAVQCLPSCLSTIGDHAFYNSPVKNITFNSQNLIIGAGAFENTGNLLEVVLNANASIREIGDNAFLNSGIHNFTVNGSIGKIGNNVFQGTGNINSFIVNESGNIQEVGTSVFENSGIHYVTLQGAVTSIGDRAFAGCGNILNVTVDSTTPYTLGEYAFTNAGIHSVNLSNGLTSVEKGTFEGCGNLETVKLPDTLTNIAEDAFKNVSNIKEITINEHVAIAPNAFSGAGGTTLQALAKTNNASAKAIAGIASAPPVIPAVTPPTPVPTHEPTVSPVKLKKVKVNKKRKKATLTWTKNKKASGYTIYRKVVKKGTKAKKAKKIKFIKVKNVKKNTTKLTLKLTKKATTYWYIKAFVKTKADGKTKTIYSKASNTKKTVCN